ncbi:3-dehydroquinate synthase [Brevibacillus humidisoli]|uniref:3-dehydroquinate synthase n=1 Tax=Brevibacillus humidisoli TaxID=2895522 RepID=UPI001E5DCA99|nr:3-dehydroquinate synthase [Brevibacillus humidisoli]UFJ42777.1 3-dehydroquinate synthase [Brevibacillus humidisoli]
MERKTLHVQLAERSYPIHIGPALLAELPALLRAAGAVDAGKLFILTDENVAPLYLERLKRNLEADGFAVAACIVEAGEQAKRLAVYEQVMTEAIEAGLDRKSLLIALGGGVIGDLGGFVAATFMRGISFVQVPTTLLAHDSSVGGKVAINHPLGKNLIGAFHQPMLVVYDTDTLRSLPKREVAAGFAEVIKHGLISDERFVGWLEQHAEQLKSLDPEYVGEAIKRGCAVKAEVVSADEREQGLRATLNLGHTFGHAFEALLDYGTLNHGEAIAIGMGLAADVAERMGLAPEGTAKRTRQLLQRFELPVAWPQQLTPEAVLEVMRRDKKSVGGKLVLILPRAIGRVEIVKEIEESLVLQVMNKAQEEQTG